MTAARRPAPNHSSPGQTIEACDPLDEWDVLASALNARGIRHIAPRRRRKRRFSDVELFRRLAQSSHARLREAAILWLLTDPSLAPAAQEAIAGLHGEVRGRAMLRYVAAAALQRMWRTRLQWDLGPQPLIPPAYLQELSLPSLNEDHGRAALLQLAQQEEEAFGHDAWAGYTSLMDLFLAEIALADWGRPKSSAASKPYADD
jgi:hypothetical protein